MTSRIGQWTIDVTDVERMGQFWAEALGYRLDLGNDGSAKLYPPHGADPSTPTVWLQPVDYVKQPRKNRTHPDLVVDGDVDAEVERLLAFGASRVDVGQRPDDPFVVLADPEGNEFCLLRREPRRARRSGPG